MSRKMQPVDTGEMQKIAKFKAESNATDKDKKVEWLYTGDKIDRDAYLLGKPIDKLLIEKEIDKPKEDIIFNTVDLAAKIREDPLFEIKKKEIEAKKRLLDNPLRLKELRNQISTKSRKSDSDSDEDSNRYRKPKHRDHHRRDSDKNQDRYRSSRADRARKHPTDRHYDHRSGSSPDEKHYKRSNRSRSRSPVRSKKPEDRPGYGLINRRDTDQPSRRDEPKSAKQLEIEELKRKIESMKQTRESGNRGSSKRDAPRRLTEAEKQERLNEMQNNAKWREDVRSSNINKYKKEDHYEKRKDDESKSRNAQAQASHLFNNMMHDAYSSTEDRIKRNIKNVQRNEASFEKNFTRK